jgi:hypothetical protein
MRWTGWPIDARTNPNFQADADEFSQKLLEDGVFPLCVQYDENARENNEDNNEDNDSNEASNLQCKLKRRITRRVRRSSDRRMCILFSRKLLFLCASIR